MLTAPLRDMRVYSRPLSYYSIKQECRQQSTAFMRQDARLGQTEEEHIDQPVTFLTSQANIGIRSTDCVRVTHWEGGVGGMWPRTCHSGCGGS